MASQLQAIIYLRDVIFDGDCDCEKNIQIDEGRSKLWFIRDGSAIKSPEYELHGATPLVSPTSNAAYSLYQLYVFAAHYLPDRDWADYILEAKLIDDAVVIESSDCDALCSFLIGSSHCFGHDASTTVPAPKRLSISTVKLERKRKNPENGDSSYLDDERRHKRARTMKHEAGSSSLRHDDAGGAATSSLFTENYGATMDHSGAALGGAAGSAIGGSSGTLPFWMTLPDPVPTVAVNVGGNDLEVSSDSMLCALTHSLTD